MKELKSSLIPHSFDFLCVLYSSAITFLVAKQLDFPISELHANLLGAAVALSVFAIAVGKGWLLNHKRIALLTAVVLGYLVVRG
jgi:hypothetical protein